MPDEPEKAESQKNSAESPDGEQPPATKPVVADQDKLRQPHLDLQAGAEKDRNPAASTANQKLHADFPNINVGQLTPSQKRLADHAAELGLKTPKLPFASLCVDGLSYNYSGDLGEQEALIPSVANLSEQQLNDRLNKMGKFWFHNGVLEFVDVDGRHHVAREIKSNIAALKQAGFTHMLIRVSDEHRLVRVPNVKGITPGGEAKEQLDVIFHTPEHENERLRWAVRDMNTKEFEYALAHGADPTVVEPPQIPLLFDALSHSNSPERNEIIRKLLAKDSVVFSKDGANGISWALATRSSTLDVMPDLLNAGHNPLQRTTESSYRKGIPAFLQIDPVKETAREELKLVVEHMLKQPDLGKAERQLIKAHHQLIDKALVSAGDSSLSEAHIVLATLKDVWAVADKFALAKRVQVPDNDRHIPQQVQEFLEPLTDVKRAPKLMQTLTAYEMTKLDGVGDLVKEFTMHVALPQALLEYSKAAGQVLNDATIRELSEHVFTSELIKNLEPAVRKILFDGRSIDKIIGLNEAWHDPLVVFPDALKPLKATGEWYSLTGQKEHSGLNQPGITIHVLTTDKELVSEGKNLAHCVGGGNYTTACLEGKTHIFSVRKAGEEVPLSTIEARWDGKTLTVVQNRGEKNATACAEAISAEQWLKQQMESGNIVANREVGETQESRTISQERPTILREIGFEITQENINTAFEEFTQNPKRRAREYNPKTEKFDTISRRTELIAGNHNVEMVDDQGRIQNKGISFKDLPADQWFVASGLESAAKKALLNSPSFNVAISEIEALRSAVGPEVEPVAINTPEVPTNAELQPGNQQSKSSAVGERFAKFFDREFFTGGRRAGFGMAANTLGAKGGLEMILHQSPYLSDNVRCAAGATLLGSSGIGLRADYSMAQATQQLAQAERTGNEVAIVLAKKSLESAQKLAHVTGATTTGLMLPLEAYQAGAAFRKGNYGEGGLYTAKTTSSGLLLGSIGYSAAANAASKGAQAAQAAGLTEKAIELAGMAGKYTKVAKFLGPIGVGIAIGTEVVDIGIKSYHIASAIQEIDEIRRSVTEAEKRAFRPSANPEYVEAMKRTQDKKAYEIADPQTAEYKHLNLTGYGNLAPVDLQSRIEAELKTLEQRKAELSKRFSDVRTVTADDFGNIVSESPSECELVQTPEGRISLKMSNHGFGLGEMIMPASYIKYDNAVSDVETVDNRIRILHAAKEELIGDANNNIGGNSHLLSYSARYGGVRQARAAYAQAVREIEPRIAEFEASLTKSNSDVPKYLDSVNERRDQYDRLQLEDSQVYAEAKKQADQFRQEYAKNPKDRLMYGLMLVTQANLEVMLSKEIQSLLEYSQTPANVRIMHVQTQQEAMESRNEMRRIQNLFSGHQPIRNETIPDEQLMVAAEITIDPNHYRWFKKDLADKGLSIATFKESEAEDGKKIYSIGFWKGHFQEYLVSQNPVGQKQDSLTVALSSEKVVTFADARQPRAILPKAIEQCRINVVRTSTQ